MRRRNLLIAALLAPLRALADDDTLLAPADFIAASFAGQPPAPGTLWLDAALQAKLEAIFGHTYPRARLSYWRQDARSVWVLEDIGKEYPITAGFVVDGAAMERAALLIYRESRGGEIRIPSFLKQFTGRRIGSDGALDRDVDGISGSTLSVNAMRRMARAALTLAAALPQAG